MFNADGRKFSMAEQNFLSGKEILDSIVITDLKSYPVEYEYTFDINNICIEIESITNNMSLFQNTMESTKNRLLELDNGFAQDYNSSFKFPLAMLEIGPAGRFVQPSKIMEPVPITKFEYLEMKLEDASNWYIKNVPTYWANEGLRDDPRGYYKTPYFSRSFGDDCTEFAAYYMSVVANTEIRKSYTLEMIDQAYCSWDDEVKNVGWNYYTTDEIANNGGLQYGDVLICDDRYQNGGLTSRYGQHAEVYIDDKHTFGWGEVKTKYPSDNVLKEEVVNGTVHYRDESGTHDYTAIYRYEGEVPDNIKKIMVENNNSTSE